MSLFSPVVSLLSIRPSWQYDGDYFFAKTSTALRLLTLFGYERRLLINRPAKMMRLSVTRWWFFRDITELSTQGVRGVLYGYKDFGTSWSVSPFWMGRTDAVEIFSVGLALTGPVEQIPLFAFVGEGSTETGWQGVILGGDSILDARGPQTEDSRNFVDKLCQALGVGILVPGQVRSPGL